MRPPALHAGQQPQFGQPNYGSQPGAGGFATVAVLDESPSLPAPLMPVSVARQADLATEDTRAHAESPKVSDSDSSSVPDGGTGKTASLVTAQKSVDEILSTGSATSAAPSSVSSAKSSGNAPSILVPTVSAPLVDCTVW